MILNYLFDLLFNLLKVFVMENGKQPRWVQIVTAVISAILGVIGTLFGTGNL